MPTWTDNPATGRRDWTLQVATCAEYESLAARLDVGAVG